LNHGEYEKFVLDKKSFNNYIKLDNSYDVGLIEYFINNITNNYEDLLTAGHNFIYREFYGKGYLNEIVPILKHLEWGNRVKGKVLKYLKKFKAEDPLIEYNSKILDTLSYVESNGLHVDKNLFKEKFGITSNRHISKDLIYTQYNPYTTTGRPSNRFGGVNFAALNKDDGSRACFKSRFENGLLVQYDYNAYHLRLIAHLLKYDFPENNIHNYFAKIYFDTDIITPELYNQSKQISFRLIYGGIPKKYKNKPFFKEVNEFIDNLWNIYINNGFFETPIFKRKMFSEFFTDMNKPKLFNYFLQAFETEMNFEILSDALKRLSDTKSKLVLYTYDSYLLDFCLDDGKQLINEFKNLIECNGAFPSTITYGLNYNDLKNL
jgi:hypothetical protein